MWTLPRMVGVDTINTKLSFEPNTQLCGPSPVWWGSTYCFTAVGVRVGVLIGVTPITKAPPTQIFFWVACFLFPRSLAFDFCYDLDIWGQGQALRAFFVVMSFFTILSKV